MIKEMLVRSSFLRSITFPLLRHFDFEITVKHDITQRPMRVMSWLHKGYWFYGSSREENEIYRFRELISEGMVVLEIGGHIGYLTQLYESLVSETGEVYVAEPVYPSRRLLEKNVLPKTVVIDKALSDKSGKNRLYTDSFGGFTNSLVREFTEHSNAEMSCSQRVKGAVTESVEVNTITLDYLCYNMNIAPDFIKIDVEGNELNVLRGGVHTLASVGSLMVEISRNHKEVFDLLQGYGFHPIDSSGKSIIYSDHISGNRNYFFIKID